MAYLDPDPEHSLFFYGINKTAHFVNYFPIDMWWQNTMKNKIENVGTNGHVKIRHLFKFIRYWFGILMDV